MKILLRLALVLAVLVALAAGGLALGLGPLLRQGLERGGRMALGVDTGVEKVEVALFSGTLTVRSLGISNPPGFERPHILAFESAELRVPPRRVLDDPLRIERVAVRGLELVLERRDGTFNYEPIREHAEAFAKERGPGEPEAPDGRRIHLVEIELDGLEVTFDLFPGHLAPQRVRLGRHVVRDLEVGGDADPLGELVLRLLEEARRYALEQGPALLDRDWREELDQLLASTGERLGREFERALERIQDGAAGKIGRELERHLDGSREDLQDAIDEQGQRAADEARQALDGLRRRRD